MSHPGPLLLDMMKHGHGAETVLAFQLFADMIERYDMLLMEVRHLQTNLIYAMRFPDLHAALRFEESFIFGSVELRKPSTDTKRSSQTGWSRWFTDERYRGGRHDLTRLAQAFVPMVPAPDDDILFHMTDGDPAMERSDQSFPDLHDDLSLKYVWRHVAAPIVRALRRVQLSGQWNDTFAMNYNVFVALQALKRNIVSDKLYLAWYGYRGFFDGALDPVGPFSNADTDDARTARRGDMMIARAVAFQNANEHVKRLADFHAQFEKTLDIGSQENHRPITGRRREQGLYHYMLGERARDMFLEVSNLTRSMLILKGDRNLFRGMPTFIHRWQHSYTSRNEHLLSFPRTARVGKPDERSRAHQDEAEQHFPSFSAFSVNTSFWMPDRPDLQPVIAHEAAHCVLMELFGDLNEPLERKGFDGPMVDLWRALITVDTDWRGPDEHGRERNKQMREVLTDILAATITGPGYLFALFQELTGHKIGEVARQGGWSEWLDMRQLETVLRHGTGLKPIGLHWYPRLMVVADVVRRSLREEEKTPLTEMLIEGVEECAETLLGRIEQLRYEFEPEQIEVWRDYTHSLLVRVRSSGALDMLRQHRATAYRTDGAAGANRLEQPLDDTSNDDRDEPLRYANLTEQTRRRLVEYLVERKAIGARRALNEFLTGKPGIPWETNEKANVARKFMDICPSLKGFNGHLRSDPMLAACAIHAFGMIYIDREDAVFRELCDLRQQMFDLCATKDSRNQPRGGKEERKIIEAMCACIPLFHRLSDVPWQTAILRAMEMSVGYGHAKPADTPRCVLETLSADYAPGRETMQLATEFWSFGRRTTVNALAEASKMVMNLVGAPMGQTERWEPDGDRARLLNRIVASLLPSFDAPDEPMRDAEREAVRDRLRAMHNSWQAAASPEKGSLCVDLAEKAAAHLKALEDGGITGAMVTDRLHEDLSAALEQWLGLALDADFVELGFRNAVEDYDGSLDEGTDPHVLATVLRARLDDKRIDRSIARLADKLRGQLRAPVTSEDVAADWLATYRNASKDNPFEALAVRMIESVKKEAWALLDTRLTLHSGPSLPGGRNDALKGLLDSVPGHLLVDGIIQSMRVFEIGHLSELSQALQSDRPFDPHAQSLKAGALQILKLDRSYPVTVFPFDTTEQALFRGDITDDFADDPQTGWTWRESPPVTLFIDQFCRSVPRGTTRIATLDAAARGVHRIHGRFLARIAEDWREAFDSGLAVFREEHSLNQAGARPRALRRLGQHRDQRRIVEAAGHKLEELGSILSFQAVPLHDVAPIRSLVARCRDRKRQQERGSETIAEAFRAMSRRGNGLLHFRTLFLSRQSLIDTHGWHGRGAAPEARSPYANDDPRRDFPAAWAQQHANSSFYREGPIGDVPVEEEKQRRATRQLTTLGRYDFFSLTNDATSSQLRQPIMDRALGRSAQEIYSHDNAPFSRIPDERRFRAFFERREHAIALSISGEPVDLTAPTIVYRDDPHDVSKDKERDVLCILSIRLDRRSTRLGFLKRLRDARRHWNNYLRPEDTAPGHADALKVDLGAGGRPFPTTDPGNPLYDPTFRQGIAASLRRAVALNVRADRDYDAKELADYERAVRAVFDPAQPGHLGDLTRELWRLRGYDAGHIPKTASRLQAAWEAARVFGDLPSLSVEASGYLLEDGDSVLLGEGWGDIYLIMHCEARPHGKAASADAIRQWRDRAARRLYDVFALQHILFQDHEVHRTEMFLRPVAIPLAASDSQRFTMSLSVRSREDRELDGLIQRMVRKTRQTLGPAMRAAIIARARGAEEEAVRRALADRTSASFEDFHVLDRIVGNMVTVSHIPGRNDLEFTIEDVDAIRQGSAGAPRISELPPAEALDAVHDLVGIGSFDGGSGCEEVSTRIGFRHLLNPNTDWISTS